MLADKAPDVLDILDVADVFRDKPAEIKVNSQQLAQTIKEVGELEEWSADWASPKSVGWQLKALRFSKDRDTTTKRNRARVITKDAFIALCQAYGLVRVGPGHTSAENVRVVQNVRPADIAEV